MQTTQMMSVDSMNLQDCVATSDHAHGGMHAVMHHADEAAMYALMNRQTPSL